MGKCLEDAGGCCSVRSLTYIYSLVGCISRQRYTVQYLHKQFFVYFGAKSLTINSIGNCCTPQIVNIFLTVCFDKIGKISYHIFASSVCTVYALVYMCVENVSIVCWSSGITNL